VSGLPAIGFEFFLNRGDSSALSVLSSRQEKEERVKTSGSPPDLFHLRTTFENRLVEKKAGICADGTFTTIKRKLFWTRKGEKNAQKLRK